MELSPSGRKLRILDFDIETRRIGFYSAGRFAPDGCEPVIIAAQWEDAEEPYVFGLGNTWTLESYCSLVTKFRELYDRADIVTGHYIRKFDLPILNGAMLECGLTPLGEKLVIDTKTDLLDFAGQSKSQENLSALHQLEESKFHMNDTWWRKVARLTPEGLALARTRVTDDIKQHMALRGQLHDWLTPPTLWKP